MADPPILATEEIFAPKLPAPVEGRPAPSPYSFEFAGEDGLRLTVHNSVAGVVVDVAYRMHRPERRTHANTLTFVPASDRSASSAEFSLGEGFLLNVTCAASAGNPRIGHTFVKLEVIRGRGTAATVMGTILQDYITARQPIAWPGSPLRASTEGSGVIRQVTGTQPAFGGAINETVPTGARWELLTFRAQLTTEVTAGLRRMLLIVYGATATMLALHATGDIGASVVGTFDFGQSFPYTGVAGTNQFLGPLPAGFTLTAGDVIQLTCNGMQNNDRYSAPTFTVREWLEAQ